MIPQTSTELSLDKISYLSFQGGGAKGASYIGALAGLAQLSSNDGIFKKISSNNQDDYVLGKNIKGISGASAGAITATLVCAGYSLRELYQFVSGGIISSFYDGVIAEKGKDGRVVKNVPRKIPYVSNKVPMTGKADDSCRELPLNTEGQNKITKIMYNIVSYKRLINIFVAQAADWLVSYFVDKAPPALAKKLNEGGDIYLKNLILDYGLFSGSKARETFDEMIAVKVKKERGTKKYGITFDDFWEIFRKDLILVGTNLVTGKSVYFCSKAGIDRKPNTGDFKVVDALRISMSFPFAFKPVVIKKGDYSDDSFIGTWIDGGLLNNNPIHAYDPSPGIINPGMLGLRLKGTGPNVIEDIIDYVSAIANSLMDTASSGQVRSAQEEAQTIILDQGGLETLDFDPTPEVLKTAINYANDTVVSHFGEHGNEIVYLLTGGPIKTTLPVRGTRP